MRNQSRTADSRIDLHYLSLASFFKFSSSGFISASFSSPPQMSLALWRSRLSVSPISVSLFERKYWSILSLTSGHYILGISAMWTVEKTWQYEHCVTYPLTCRRPSRNRSTGYSATCLPEHCHRACGLYRTLFARVACEGAKSIYLSSRIHTMYWPNNMRRILST